MQLQSITTVTIPGHKIYEYLLVISPHEELRSRIRGIKNKFAEDYKAEYAKQGKPGMALVNFIQYEMMEEKILNRLRVIAMGCSPFKIELRDFGSFPSHTIYINIVSKVPVQHLVKTIRHEAQRLMKLNEDNKPHFIMEPHLTIAWRLQPWQYEKGWQEYSQKNFTGRFIADSMLLLKRVPGEIAYQRVEKFEFLNMPVSTKQGELFL
jgi:2'-5' RNA ligase